MIIDTYQTIASASDSYFIEKRSKFLSFALPITTIEEVKNYLAVYQRKYYDARHLCYAYRLGPKGDDFRANDNGEPSGTAGKPILGQLKSFELTNVLVIVVRYFGGIKLGTGGLIVAYRAAAYEVLSRAEIIEKTVNEEVTLTFEYPFMNDVMHIIKAEELHIISQNYNNDCEITLSIRLSKIEYLKFLLEKVDTARIKDLEQ
jgi:uncharacterized YigZ family protein